MSDDVTPSAGAVTAAGIADRVRAALEAADVDAFADLLSPDVQWGAPGDPKPPCRNRSQVLRWYERGRAAGRWASVTALEVHGDTLLVGLRLDTEEERWQILRVGPEGISDIRGYEDRPTAELAL